MHAAKLFKIRPDVMQELAVQLIFSSLVGSSHSCLLYAGNKRLKALRAMLTRDRLTMAQPVDWPHH
jgi:hypothetical protein